MSESFSHSSNGVLRTLSCQNHILTLAKELINRILGGSQILLESWRDRLRNYVFRDIILGIDTGV